LVAILQTLHLIGFGGSGFLAMPAVSPASSIRLKSPPGFEPTKKRAVDPGEIGNRRIGKFDQKVAPATDKPENWIIPGADAASFSK
jgi:hypothetical protein